VKERSVRVTSSLTERKEVRRFGAIALPVFGALCAAAVWRGHEAVSVFFGVLAALGLLFLLVPEPLRPVYCGWLTVTRAIGTAVTLTILTVSYFLVITPAALFARRAARRALPQAPDRNASTYWVTRTEPLQEKERFHKRY
jgi:hypothetical protein